MKRMKDNSVGVKLRVAAWISALLFFSITTQVIGGSATLSNGTDVSIPDGTGIYIHSPITFSSAPSGATVNRIDYSFVITHPYGGDLDVDLNDHTRTAGIKANLWTGTLAGGTDSGVNPTRSASITSGSLIGLPVNQTWYLAAADVDSGSVGYINTWTMTVYWADSQPNLTPYLPSGWSDKIVVSTTTGNNTDSSGLTTANTLYVDWAVLNNGTAATASRFATELYVDGSLRTSWGTDPPLNVNFYANVLDYNLGTLSAGSHTIRIKTDSTGVIAESNESVSDNEYTKTITISSTAGTINSTLANVSGLGYTPQNVRFVLNTSPSRQATGNPATFLSVSAGTYLVEGYQTGNWWGEEFWNSKQVSISAGQDMNTTLTRDHPYVSSIVISNVTSGGVISAGQNINAGTQVRAYVAVRNNVGSALNSRVRFLFDINQAASYDFDSGNSSAQSVPGGGGTSVFIFNFTPATSGQYYDAYAVQTYVNSAYILTDSDTWRQTFNAVAVYPNLTPYQPTGYSDKLVVSKTAGTHTDSSPLNSTDTLYVDWAVINNGAGATSARFTTDLYVDGVLKSSWSTDPPLNVNGYAYVDDYSIGALSAGTHMIKLKTDVTGVIPESNESVSDNEYTKTITVNAVNAPNLTPFQPLGWSDKIVVSRAAGNNTDSTGLTIGDSLYVDWAVLNNGNAAATGTFYTYLYVDDVFKYSWYTLPPLNANYYTAAFDFAIGSLSAGMHTIKITTDATGVIGESGEADNPYTKTISVVGTALPDFQITSITLNPASPQPGQAFTANVTVRNQGAGSGDGKWLDVWANQPSVQTCGTDGNTWAEVGTLTAGQSKLFTLYLTAPASAGTYTFRAFVNSYCQTTESNEGNNQTTLAYTSGSTPQLPNFLVSAITFNPAQPVGGQPFTASVTVRNQGAVSGDGKYLDVWLNQPSSQVCGAPGGQSQSVGTLSVNQTKTLTFNLTAPPSGSPWTFRAFVDSTCQTPENNDGDNQLTASYGINPVAQPDFMITAITISPSNLKPSDKFSASVTVKNLGTVSGNAGWLDVWANRPTTAACSEPGNGYSTVGTLAASESKVITIANLTAGPAGNNTLRAFIDSKCASTEGNEANNQKTFDYKTSQRVLVLLHGMNSNPEKWQHYLEERFNGSAPTSPIIWGGMKEPASGSPVADSHGVVCYRVRFGYYDATSGRSGVEGVSAIGDSAKDKGDFSTFDTLGLEVWDAVNYILSVYPGAQVTLLGHSRGGIAARAFLQEPTSSPEKASVVGLLTTGTPHKGSPLGKIYPYLNSHSRGTANGNYWEDDWEVADQVLHKGELDVRRPTIEDLANTLAPSEIASLNASIGNLPINISYRAITYSGLNLGYLKRNAFGAIDYSIFPGDGSIGEQVSSEAEDYMLGSGSDPNDYPGDGTVPVASQRYDDIQGFPATKLLPFSHGGIIFHTEEPEQETHITDALGELLDWWQ